MFKASNVSCFSPHHVALRASPSPAVSLFSFLPLSPHYSLQYHVSQSYIRSKMAKDVTTGPEGVEVRECRPFTDPAMGSGQFYHNIYYLER